MNKRWFGYFVGNDRPYVSQGTDVVKSRLTNFTDLTIHCKMIIKSDSQNFYLFFQCSSGVRNVHRCDVHMTVSTLTGAKRMQSVLSRLRAKPFRQHQ